MTGNIPSPFRAIKVNISSECLKISSPTTQMTDILRILFSITFTNKTGLPAAIMQFHLAKAEWLRDALQETAKLIDRYAPDFDVDRAATATDSQHAGTLRWPAR